MVRSVWLSAIIIIAVWGLKTTESNACSVCRCGENTFLCSEQVFGLSSAINQNHFYLNFGSLYSTKSSALDPEEGVGTERQREFRPSVRLGFSPTNNISFALEVPMQFRRIESKSDDETGHEQTSGIGDAELSAVLMQRLWNSGGQFYTGGLSLTAKLPTGKNKLEDDGERMDEHLQTGTGALDWQFGAAFSRITHASLLFTSMYYRLNGTNDFEYHYGNALLFNVGAQIPLLQSVSGTLQANGRHARRDTDDNEEAENTGGTMVYLSPGIKLMLTKAATLAASVQIPVYKDLYGNQSEKAVLSTGISYQF